MPKIVKFHDPYHPNDGHGPGVELPRELYTCLLFLNGEVRSLETTLGILSETWPMMTFTDHGDYIAITQYLTPDERGIIAPSHNWLGIAYTEITHPLQGKPDEEAH